MPTTWHEFVERWSQSGLREQQAAQSHFNEICQLVGHKTPAEADPKGEFFTFEENVQKATGGRGRADVWYRGKFAWEYKGKHRDLDAAYAQLLAYRGDLDNPPLLVVCDFLEYRIYPQWPNTSGQPFIFRNAELTRPDTQRFLNWLLFNPGKFLELRQEELNQRESLTLDLAKNFSHLADLMRRHRGPDGKLAWQPMQIARFLTRLTFCLFAEDVGLMPRPFDQPVFRYLTDGARSMPGDFVEQLRTLFEAMDGRRPGFVMKAVPYFNGGLFAESAPGAGDGYEALDITQIPDAIDLLERVSQADWRRVNPTIFGTLFEGALDEGKRAQLGAHYTSEADIRLVIEPVLMAPLYREWERIEAEAGPHMQRLLNPDTLPRDRSESERSLIALHDGMMARLGSIRALDPACGSGNFLYMSLRALKDLEGRVRKYFEPLGVPFRDMVTPRQLYGIEKDEFAARLAQVVVWIGYLQWRYEDEGGMLRPLLKATSRPHPRQLPHPILQDKWTPDEPDHIQCADAILRYDADGQPYEPEWPAVDVIIGNPPFLGDKKMRTEMGHAYVETLRNLYRDRVPGGADLVTYWFEKARAQIEQAQAKRAGLLATNSIRGGTNRVVLDRIKDTGDIFMAWSDRDWVLEGAAVRISIVGFDDGSTETKILDGSQVAAINPDLTTSADLTSASILKENKGLGFIGDTKKGQFDIPEALAMDMIAAKNQSGKDNREVVVPWINGLDITRRNRSQWIIDFGAETTEAEASAYEIPFQYVKSHVKPVRDQVRNEAEKRKWWLHARPAPDLRKALIQVKRYIGTPRVGKHRCFLWLDKSILPDNQVVVFAREDDYFFGVLHAYLHEIWSLRQGTWLGVGNDPRYTPTTTFETYPFPWPPGKEATASAAHQAISAAARQLHAERDRWLNPPDLLALNAAPDSKTLRERTLTNLYNALVAYRKGNGNGGNGEKIPKAAREFAPRLAELHDALDAAVLSAYGWDDLIGRLRTADGDEEVLRRLLALNLAR